MMSPAQNTHNEAEREEARHDRLVELLRDSHREAVPLRESFLQLRAPQKMPGPLGEIVRHGLHNALDLYLLIHAATATPPHRVFINSTFWGALLRRPEQSDRNARLTLGRGLAAL